MTTTVDPYKTVAELAERNVRLQAHLDEAERLLRELEWSGPEFGEWTTCPLCEKTEIRGHTPDCRLGNLLKETV